MIQWTTERDVFLAHLCAGFVQMRNQCCNGVVGVMQYVYKRIFYILGENLVEQGISDFVLARKIVIQRALGDPGAINNVLNAGGLKTVQMDFAKCRVQDFFPRALGWLLMPALPPVAVL